MPAKTLNRIFVVKTKPGMSAQWESGPKKLNEWAKQQNYPFAYYDWSLISGPRTGQYILGTFGHDWKDFDGVEKFGPAAAKQIHADMAPFTESVNISYWSYREDLSGCPPNPGQAPPAFFSITTFFLKIGADLQVADAIKVANAAIQKSHWPGKPSGWYSLVKGGYGPALTLATGHENWADFQSPETSLAKVLNEVYGKEGAEAI
jgi:hypothetical protein